MRLRPREEHGPTEVGHDQGSRNAALHRIAATQIRVPGPADRPTTSDDEPKETQQLWKALRALKRRLARVVFNLLQPTTTGHIPAAAWHSASEYQDPSF